LIEESRLRAVESQPALEQMLDWFLDDVASGGLGVAPRFDSGSQAADGAG
jgi:hypothetical protein